MTSSKSYRRVVAYLREMVEYCHIERHRDMEHYYERGLRFVLSRIYGELPEKPDYSALIKWAPEPKPAIPPVWKQKQMARPSCKIVQRVTELDRTKYEVLECGHRNYVYSFAGYSQDASKLASHRRCERCAEKKPAASVARVIGKAAVVFMLLFAVTAHAQIPAPPPDALSSFSVQDGIDLGLIFLPLAALLVGVGIGVTTTKWGYFMQYRLHLDTHWCAAQPDPSCPFCTEERGIVGRILDYNREKIHSGSGGEA